MTCCQERFSNGKAMLHDDPCAEDNRGVSAVTGFQAWRGISGRRIVVSVYPVDAIAADAGLPDYDGAIVMAVSRGGMRRMPVAVVEVEQATDLRSVRRLAQQAGVDEWHVHLLARDRAGRRAVADDLRRAQAAMSGDDSDQAESRPISAANRGSLIPSSHMCS